MTVSRSSREQIDTHGTVEQVVFADPVQDESIKKDHSYSYDYICITLFRNRQRSDMIKSAKKVLEPSGLLSYFLRGTL